MIYIFKGFILLRLLLQSSGDAVVIKKHSKNTVAIDGLQKDCNNRRNKMQNSKIKKYKSSIISMIRRADHVTPSIHKSWH
jgi:hypothetical protein